MLVKSSLITSLLLLAARGHDCDEDDSVAPSTVTSTGTIQQTTFVTQTLPSGSSAPAPSAGSNLFDTGCLLYTVSAQDTGLNIAKSFGLELSALNTANPGTVWEKLEAGSQILIPAGSTTQPAKNVAVAPSCKAPPKTAADAATNTGAPASVVAASPPASAAAAPSAAAAAPVANSAAAPSAKPVSAAALQAGAPSTAVAAPSANAAPAAAAQSATAATSGCKTYTVIKGDTGESIAKAAGITLPEILAQNTGMVWEKMQIGQVLTLPPKAIGANLGTSPDCKAASIIAAPASGASGSAAPSVKASAAPAAGSGSAAASPAASSPAAAAASGAAAQSSPAPAIPGGASGIAVLASVKSYLTAQPTATAQTVGGSGAEPVSALIHMGAVTDCSKSADPRYTDECTTAKDAAGPIIDGFNRYKITTPGEQAAILSLMILESAGFKYNHKHFPTSVPGQGTYNMMEYKFVAEYIQEIAQELQIIVWDEPDVMLKKVNSSPKHSFASAAWFYSKKCSDAVKKGVQAGTTAGYEAYLKDCVGTTVTPERTAGYEKAREELGVPKS